MLPSEPQQVGQIEAFEERQGDMLDLRALDHAPLVGDQVLQVEDVLVAVPGQVGAHVAGEEAVDL